MMGVRRNYISNILYILALLLLVGVGAGLLVTFREFIFTGKGIGVYGSLIYYTIAFVSAVLWGVSYFVSKNSKLAMIFWLIFISLTTFVIAQPSWWAAP
jgi:hypothetical protein